MSLFSRRQINAIVYVADQFYLLVGLYERNILIRIESVYQSNMFIYHMLINRQLGLDRCLLLFSKLNKGK